MGLRVSGAQDVAQDVGLRRPVVPLCSSSPLSTDFNSLVKEPLKPWHLPVQENNPVTFLRRFSELFNHHPFQRQNVSVTEQSPQGCSPWIPAQPQPQTHCDLPFV